MPINSQIQGFMSKNIIMTIFSTKKQHDYAIIRTYLKQD